MRFPAKREQFHSNIIGQSVSLVHRPAVPGYVNARSTARLTCQPAAGLLIPSPVGGNDAPCAGRRHGKI
jgi:hypothetical protein